MTTAADFDKKKYQSDFSFGEYTPSKKYTLSDLRKDQEFNKVTERFLESLGEGETPDDLFEYFRGSDWNLGDAMEVYSKSKKFTPQQKSDYQYLRSKFDNASLGGFKDWALAAGDISYEMVTDPTMLASLLLVPWTGGASAATRIASSKVAQTALKKLANKEIAEGVAKGVAKIPGQKLKAPLSKNAQTALASTEGFIYGSTNNFAQQSIDVNTDRREDVNLKETAAIGALSAAAPVLFRGAGAGISKFGKSVQERRAARIDGNEDYKGGILDKGIEKFDEVVDAVTPNIRKLSAFVNKPTTKFVEKMKESKQLDKLIKLFRYDTDRSITAKGYDLAQEVSERSFYEHVNNMVGKRSEQLKAILDPLKTKGKIMVPKIGSRDAFFKIPFKDAPKAEKESFFRYQRIDDNTNDALAYYLRTGNKTVKVGKETVSLEKAFNLTDKTTDDIVKAGTDLRKLLDDIRNDAEASGLEIGFIKNYLPRGFSYGEVKAEIRNLEKGIEGKLVKELKEKEGLKTNQEVIDLLTEIIDPSVVTGKSYVELATLGKGGARAPAFEKRVPGLTKERQLTNIDENNISEYLDNNVESLLGDYIHQASSFIERKKYLGEDLDEFVERFIKPIQDDLKAKGKSLTSSELKSLENIYLVTTGQVKQIDNAFLRAASDVALVGNQLALLPFATITSFSEIAVPLVRGAGKKLTQKGETELDKGGVRILWETANDFRKMWWNDVVKKDVADARPESLKELNRFNRAVNRANEDRSLAMYGQGFSRRATQAQNKFFKLNMLHDWTRFVQLVSFNVGKSKIYDNLYELSTSKTLNKTKRTRLENELKELGVNVDDGIKWVQGGGKPSGVFYDEQLLPSAARYVDEVVMNPTAAANQKPLWHSMPSTRWAFGLMGFPTAFSNTVLKNAIREVSKDVRGKNIDGIPRAIGGTTAMIGIAMFGNTLRTRGQNLEDIESGEKDIGDEIKDAAIRTGLLGPTEQLYRTQKGLEYDNFARSIIQRFTGPAVDDIFRFFDDWTGPLSFAVDEAPGIAALRSLDPEGYKAIKKAAKDVDDSLGLTRAKKPKVEKPVENIPLFATGGLVEGPDVVPYTKDNPADRVDPFTGSPYSEQMTRLGFKEGGKVKKEEENKINVYHYLKEKGLRTEAIIGIMANIDKETGIKELGYRGSFSHKQQETGNSKLGTGLFQFTTKLHKEGYQQFLKDNNLKDSNEANIDYFLDTIMNPESKMRSKIGGRNLDEIKEKFENGSTKEITEAITNKWLKPKTYINRLKNPEAHLENLNDRNVRADRLSQEINMFDKEFDFVSSQDLRYLPNNVSRRLENFNQTNGKIYLPREEAESLNVEIAAERMSKKALRNDPQGRGFHGGDPEYDPRVVTGDPAEIKGRQGIDEYGTRPKIYRATNPESPLFFDKYVNNPKNLGQFDTDIPAIRGAYIGNTDELLLSSTKDKSMKKTTEPHEYMHRGLKNKNLTEDEEHEYIDEVFYNVEMKDFNRQLEMMTPEQITKARKYLESQRDKLKK